ncbi:DUF4386 domain-containing protein [Microbacterium sp. NPDC019599]|uniref:DUF4386 domain-containing protein n=1 Tax=Microbacterium sp. NPDC019599 TaxID=3154690 RepID=UPI00340C5655
MDTQKRTARATGAWYLAVAVTGMLGFLVIRPQLYIADDPAASLANVTENAALAHLGLGLEMALVVVQALTAVWFYKLLRPIAPTAGFAVAAFGLLNGAAVMASGVFLATALWVAESPVADPVGAVGLLDQLSTNAWGMGSLFFGLWLIPMGWAAITTGRMPVLLGWLLVVGGVAYLVSAFAGYAVADAPAWATDYPPFLATIGEFWMIGYLLTVGIRPADDSRAVVRVRADSVAA